MHVATTTTPHGALPGTRAAELRPRVPVPTPSPQGPQRLGRFLLVERIALGGMAEIWLAIEDPERRLSSPASEQKHLVIKRILPHYACDTEFVSFFLNEGAIATRLHHPNLIETYELGQVDGQYFLVMEHVQGETLLQALQRSLRRGRHLPLGFIVDAIRGAATGLAYAHTATDDHGQPLGIVHRDVSPHNILLGFDGCVKMLDFGVAKAVTQLHHTVTGTIKGKLSYVAPEQIQGDIVDARADIFSLGVVLYEALASHPLFKADSEARTLERVLHAPIPPLAQVRPECPPELERIARRALERDLSERYQHAGDFAEDLGHVRAFIEDAPDIMATTIAELFPQELPLESTTKGTRHTGSWPAEPVTASAPAASAPQGSGLWGILRAAFVLGAALLLGHHGGSAPSSLLVREASAAAPQPQPRTAPARFVTDLAGPTVNPAQPPASLAPTAPRAHMSANAMAGASPGPSDASGRLRVIADPWAELEVDGKPAGMTPAPSLSLHAGSHLVTLRNSDLGREMRRHVVVPAGGEAVLRVNLFTR